jgi:vancomycin resistance protein YoaR
VGWLARPAGEAELANFSTSLAGRTRNQRHNARLAAAALDGVVLPPGGEFSFNRTVGPWTRDKGYKRAPVSYGGEMVITWGGGVCQVSSTLYNAALLAGLTVRERDHHVWAPLYVPPGRDAAVAYGIADLRLRNPYAAPVRLEARVQGETLLCRLVSRARPGVHYRVVTELRETIPAPPLVRFDRDLPTGRQVRRTPGRPGCSVRTYRLTLQKGRVIEKELLSDDEYKAMSPRVRVGE